MNLTDLVGKKIDAAALSSPLDAIFLLASNRKIWTLCPDFSLESHKGRCCILSAKQTEVLKDCEVTAVVESDTESSLGDKAVFTETAIHTTKGVCLIVCAISGGMLPTKIPLVLLEHKGYPPSDAVTLCDFARCLVPGQVNVERRQFSEQVLQTLQPHSHQET